MSPPMQRSHLVVMGSGRNCNAATSSIARKALSFLRKPTCARVSSCSMKL